MRGTITDKYEALAAGVRWVKCPTHGRMGVPLAHMDTDGIGNVYCEQCEDDQRGSGYRLVPANGPAWVEEEFPALFANGYSQLPDELIDYGHLLGLKALELALIAAIWRHQARGGTSYPDEKQLARESGQSKRSVQRCAASLSERGLLYVVHRYWTHNGARAANEYDLCPLWQRLTRVVAEHQSAREALPPGQRGATPLAREAPQEEQEEDRATKGESVLTHGTADAAMCSSESTSEDTSVVEPPRTHAHTREGGADDELDLGPPAEFEPLALAVELGSGAAEQPAAEPADEDAVADAEAVLAGGGDGLAAAGDGARSGDEGVGIGHAADVGIEPLSVQDENGGLVGGPCPDALRCEHRMRYPSGPSTCAANHPRLDGSPPEGRWR